MAKHIPTEKPIPEEHLTNRHQRLRASLNRSYALLLAIDIASLLF